MLQASLLQPPMRSSELQSSGCQAGTQSCMHADCWTFFLPMCVFVALAFSSCPLEGSRHGILLVVR